MKTYDTSALIEELQAILRSQLEQIHALRALPMERLRERPAPERWSLAEIVQHMVLTSGHYHRELERVYADGNNDLRFRTAYRPGQLGQWFTEGMRPKPNGAIGWKMRTLGRFEPKTLEATDPFKEFEGILHGFMGLLERARTRGLEGVKVMSTLGPIIRFKVGDAFRFPIAHQERHFLQIERTLEALNAGGSNG